MQKLIYILYIVAAGLFVASVACQGSTRESAVETMACQGSTRESAAETMACKAVGAVKADAPTAAASACFMPGDTVPDEVVKARGLESFFSESALPDSVFAVMNGKSYGKGCTVARSTLRYITCLHVTADGHSVMGEMVLNASIAKKVLDIMHQLYEAHYPIERMRLVDNYGADDERSMAANNSSGFNFRFVAGSTKVSKHGQGLAVDINPLYNPCRRTSRSGNVTISPAAGKPYADRTKTFDYKIVPGDLCHRLFKAAGFRWGGDWRTVKDYQHFEMP